MKKPLLVGLIAGFFLALGFAAYATEEHFGTYSRYSGTGALAGDTLFTTTDISGRDACVIMSSTGAVQVFVSINGTDYATAPLSLQDFGAVTNDPALTTVAGRVYGFVGKYRNVKVKQSGATATAASMNCWNSH